MAQYSGSETLICFSLPLYCAYFWGVSSSKMGNGRTQFMRNLQLQSGHFRSEGIGTAIMAM